MRKIDRLMDERETEMSYWWYVYGHFAPDQSGCYPQPRRVLMQYRQQAGLSRQALADRLGVRANTLFYAETQGVGLDSVARLRELCLLLTIPHVLFGLCTAPTGDGWWSDYGPWPAESDGWPHAGAVIKWYRRAKGWTQVQLAEALDLQELMVRKMENNNFGLNSLSRRRAVGFLLSIPPLLLGLDAVHASPQAASVTSTPLSSAPQLVSLEKVQTIQARLWSGYYTGHAQEKIPQVRKLLAQIDDVLLQVPEAERPAWLETQSLGYQWLGNVLRDHADTRMILAYNKKAVEAARLTGDADLLSIALLRQMESAYWLSQNEQAVELAQALVQTREADPVLSSGRAIASARVLALAASDQADRSHVLHLVGQCQNFGNSYGINNTPEACMRHQAEILLNLSSSGRDRARLLSQASDLLEQLEQKDPFGVDIRRKVGMLVIQARVTLARKEYDQATGYALDALPLVKELQSWRYVPQLVEIYRTLLQSSYAGSSHVARLGLQLFEVGAL